MFAIMGAFAMMAMLAASSSPGASLAPGLQTLMDFAHLPSLRTDALVHYIGSIDKKGGNADWDWGLYQDSRSEWVLAEAEGPGCLWSFVVHHDVARSDPMYRFYFDGEMELRFSILHSEFGSKAPFVPPLADWYGPKIRSCKDPRVEKMDFRIIRSFLPMPFEKGFRVTSSLKLEGNAAPNSGAGGWGHAIYHSYPSAEGVRTFTGKEDIATLLAASSRLGELPANGCRRSACVKADILPGVSIPFFSAKGEGVVDAVRIRLPKWSREAVADLWVRCCWEDEREPAVNLPFGTFFGNEYGERALKTSAMGFVPEGFSYQLLPMPHWQSARLDLVNRSQNSTPYEFEAEVSFRAGHFYERSQTGHFRASPWRQPLPGQPGEDAVIADFQGHGHAVAGVVARLGGCEGDIRVHIDGRSTPSVQSDGSESWICYGWGYYSAPESNPFCAYDGPNGNASMLRLLLGDLYPFRQGLRFSAEPGCGFRTPTSGTVRTGSVFWYGEPGLGAVVSDLLDIGDELSEKAHSYRAVGGRVFKASSYFEGAQDHIKLVDDGRVGFSESSFEVAVDPGNKGVILRRRSSQAQGRHRAFVEVDGERVAARAWLWPDNNPHQSWLEDEFQLPASMTAGKSILRIRIVPQFVDGVCNWNECRYTVFSLGVPASVKSVPSAVPGKDLPSLPSGEAGL